MPTTTAASAPVAFPPEPATGRSGLRRLSPQVAGLAAGVAALLVFALSFLPYYTYKVEVFGYALADSVTAWDAWPSVTGILLILAGAIPLTALAVESRPTRSALRSVARIGAAALLTVGWVCLLVSLFYMPGEPSVTGLGLEDIFSVGRHVGCWLVFAAATVAMVLGWWSAVASRRDPAYRQPPA
ncbi:MAG: hypothetical protein LBR33_02185 [Propionibacteriaceae bacterium]|nr:hypothetical protein [Propionibacteriaceae bacterium]